jgi:hypothetical protein
MVVVEAPISASHLRQSVASFTPLPLAALFRLRSAGGVGRNEA